jgi:hypothetical protein
MKVRYHKAEEIIANIRKYHGFRSASITHMARLNSETELEIVPVPHPPDPESAGKCSLPRFQSVDGLRWVCGHFAEID